MNWPEICETLGSMGIIKVSLSFYRFLDSLELDVETKALGKGGKRFSLPQELEDTLNRLLLSALVDRLQVNLGLPEARGEIALDLGGGEFKAWFTARFWREGWVDLTLKEVLVDMEWEEPLPEKIEATFDGFNWKWSPEDLPEGFLDALYQWADHCWDGDWETMEVKNGQVKVFCGYWEEPEEPVMGRFPLETLIQGSSAETASLEGEGWLFGLSLRRSRDWEG